MRYLHCIRLDPHSALMNLKFVHHDEAKTVNLLNADGDSNKTTVTTVNQ